MNVQEPSEKINSIAFFDFDGTITTKDSLAEFLKFLKGKFRYYLGLMVLAPIIILYKTKILSNHRAKEILLAYYLKGMALEEFNLKCKEFSETALLHILNNNALFEIRKHLNDNTPVIVITASPENWVKPWCNKYNITCISTKLETKNGKLTGKIEGLNCSGEEKVRRILDNYDLKGYTKIYAYGDTREDLHMLKLATDKHYKPFRKKTYQLIEK